MVTTRSKTRSMGRKSVSPYSKPIDSKESPKESQGSLRKRGAVDKGSVSRRKRNKTPSASKSVFINRSPVLQLWSATVAHFLHPSLSWETCLSAGSAISSICAISKGRSIGMIDKPKDERSRKQNQDDHQFELLELMQFKLKISDGLIYVGGNGRPKSASEEGLRTKFGIQYDEVKGKFEQTLNTWKGHEDELDELAFGMYEEFRPSVKAGQRGWGRKGELSLESVRKVVEREKDKK